MTPAPTAPVPVLPHLPGRPLPTMIPATLPGPGPAPVPLQARSFDAILAAGQPVAPAAVSATIAPTPLAELSTNSPVASDAAELPMSLLSSQPALPQRTLSTPSTSPAMPQDRVEQEAPVDETHPSAPSPSDAVPVFSATTPLPPVHADKAPVSLDIAAKTSVAPEATSAPGVPTAAGQIVTASVSAKARPETELPDDTVRPAILLKPETPVAELARAKSKTTADSKALWTTLLSQAAAKPMEAAVPSHESSNALPASFTARPFEIPAPTVSQLQPGGIAQVSDRMLDVARGNLWIDQLAGDIAAARQADGELNFRLIPERLGQLDVQIAMRDAGMELQFTAQNDEAASIVAAAQPRLLDELRSQGVRVSGSEVGSSAGQPGQQSGGGQQGHMPRQQPAPLFDQPAFRPAGSRQQAASDEGRFA